MTVLYKKENNQFTASFEDSQGFKTHFGPYPIKLSMILCVHEHFRNSKKQIPIISKQPWESLIINGVDYGKQLYDLKSKIDTSHWYQFQMIKDYGLWLINPLAERVEVRNPVKFIPPIKVDYD